MAPVSGARVSINGRYDAASDGMGQYAIDGLLDLGPLATGHNLGMAFADQYETSAQYVRGTHQDFVLRPIQHIDLGVPTPVTVAPTDTLCLNNMQDPTFGPPNFECRTVRVIAPTDGLVTIEALSAAGAHPPLEVEAVELPCCDERIANPTTIHANAGGEIIINVEIPDGSTASQSFVVTASVASSAPLRRR